MSLSYSTKFLILNLALRNKNREEMAKKKELTIKEKLEKVSNLLYDIKTNLEGNDTDERTAEMCIEASILIDEIYDEVG